ncbi:MAG: FMN-binding protein [Blastococcus sp.]
MSPRARIVLWVASTVTVLVLLFGYQTSTSGPMAAGGQKVISAQGLSGGVAGSSSAAAPSSAAGATGSAAPGAAKKVTGQVADTRWGPVQVQLTITGRKITDVAVVQYPDGNGRDQEINSQALPILIQETMQAQSANIDMVSGATVTSDGYLQSLQSALDQAGL